MEGTCFVGRSNISELNFQIRNINFELPSEVGSSRSSHLIRLVESAWKNYTQTLCNDIFLLKFVYFIEKYWFEIHQAADSLGSRTAGGQVPKPRCLSPGAGPLDGTIAVRHVFKPMWLSWGSHPSSPIDSAWGPRAGIVLIIYGPGHPLFRE